MSDKGKVINFPGNDATIREVPSAEEVFHDLPDDGYAVEDEDPKWETPAEKWVSVADMLSKIIGRIGSGEVAPGGAIVLLYEEHDEGERLRYYSMGVSRLEVLGLLADVARMIP